MSQKKNRKKSDIYPGAGPLCCHCGSPAVLRPASEVCRTHRKGAMAYVCAKYPACDSYVMACPGTLRPMGSLAGPELRRLRRQAYPSYNRLYETGLMSKKKVYEWLAYTPRVPHVPRPYRASGRLLLPGRHSGEREESGGAPGRRPEESRGR